MSRRGLWLLFIFFLGLYSAGNWILPLIDRDEPRFAEASREMLQRGDFIVPYFNNEVRFDKPPLIYWLQDGAYKLFGENEFGARFPNAICGALAVVMVALWGAQLYDPRTGWRAAMIFGLCVQTMIHAHAAVADMAMVAASAASAWAGWNWLTQASGAGAAGGRRWTWWLAFWGLLAVGFLAKGPIAWIPIGMIGWTAAKMESGKRPGALEWIAGAALMIALVGIWGIPALLRTHGQYAAVGLGHHVVMRTVSPMQGHGARSWLAYAVTFPYYFATVWFSFFPWCIWLPGLVAALWTARKTWQARERCLVVGIALGFGIFTLSWTKLPHYTLPVFPYMALLMAGWLGEMEQSRARLFRTAAIAMVAGSLLATLLALPVARRYFVSQQLYEKAAPLLTRQMQLGTVDYGEPSVTWLFRSQIDGFDTQMNWKDAQDWMAQSGPRVLVAPSAEIAANLPTINPAWQLVTAAGYDVANARKLELTAIVKR